MDPDVEPPDDPYDPDEIEVGVAATEHSDGGVTIDIVTYIDGLPAPNYADLVNGTPWRKIAEYTEETEVLPATQTDGSVDVEQEGDDDPHPPLPRDAPHGDIDAIHKEWHGWVVIRRPQEDGQWVAMPEEMAVLDIRNMK